MIAFFGSDEKDILRGSNQQNDTSRYLLRFNNTNILSSVNANKHGQDSVVLGHH